MEALKPKGSFVLPEEIKQHIVESQIKPKAAEPAPEAAPVTPPTADAAKTEESQEEKSQKYLLTLKEKYQKTLDISITPEDIHDYIFKGRITKKDVSVIKGYLTGVFRTHTPAEYTEIDARMAKFRDAGAWTQEGLENERAILILSYGWMIAGGRPLGGTPAERESTIRQMGAHVVDIASEAMTGFNFLLKYALQEKNYVKKS